MREAEPFSNEHARAGLLAPRLGGDRGVGGERSLVVGEADLQEALELVPWDRLLSLSCEHRDGATFAVTYRWGETRYE